MTRWIEHQTKRLERHIDRSDASDHSVYTGSAGMKVSSIDVRLSSIELIGIALLYLRLAILFPGEKDKYKSKAKSLIDACLEHLNGKIEARLLD